MKKIILLSLILVLVFRTNPSYAQDSTTTPSSQNVLNQEESIRNKVREKIEEIKRSPKAYIGTITDISKDSLQIRNMSGEIQLVSFNPDNTSFVQINKVSKKASFGDLGIGDFTVAMGFKNETGVLDAKRVLITNPLKTLTRSVIFGEIVEIDKKTVKILTKDQKQITLEFPKRWKGPEIKELEKSSKVIVVGELKENTLSLRTIVSIPVEPSPTQTITE